MSTTSKKMFFVYGRFRPLNEREKYEGDGKTTLVDGHCTSDTVTISDLRQKPSIFSFALDRIFYPDSGQRTVYDEAMREHVQRFVETADDANMLTYGQTSSGKTWTIDGNFYGSTTRTVEETIVDENLGLMPRLLAELCRRYDGAILISYYEIYCEKIFDLLNGHEHGERKECRFSETNGHVSIEVSSYDAASVPDNRFERVCALLRASNHHRHFNTTAMNAQSSRSHTFLEIKCPTAKQGRTHKTFRIVDLAGSERVTKTQAKEQTLVEGVNINNSLMYLKQMIEIVAATSGNRRKSRQVIPKFRETKLTRILHASINEGRARTILILCCSPSPYNYNETVNTLRFGCTAKRIEREIIDSSRESELMEQQRETKVVVMGLHGTQLDDHNERLRSDERREAAARLKQLETELKMAQHNERTEFQQRIDEHEHEIERLRNTVQAQSLSIETLTECRRTITLQRNIIDELTNEKQRMRKELQIYQLFREYLMSTCSSDEEDEDYEDDDKEDYEQQTMHHEDDEQRAKVSNLLKMLERNI